jgi:hypothetical protein
MLPSHLLRMVNVCVSGDYSDPAVRQRIKQQCIPFLSQHRRELLAGSFPGRHSRPVGFIRKVSGDAQLIRRTLSHTHALLHVAEPVSNVVSFAAAAQRRASTTAVVAKVASPLTAPTQGCQ